MDPLVSTLVLILVALLGTRFSFSTEGVPPGPRLIFRTGTHFVFLGFLLGPHGLDLLTVEALGQLDPLMALGLGWVGFLFGLQLDRENLRLFSPGPYAVALGQAALAFFLFLGAGWLLLGWAGPPTEIDDLLLLSAAATACITTPAGIALVSANFYVRGEVRHFLFFTASVDALVGLTALQVAYALHHPSQLAPGIDGVPAAGWMVVALGLATICAILFLWLTRRRPGPEELVLYLLGISALASGAALQLQLAPLFVCMVMGALVANLHADRHRIFAALEKWEKPIYLVLLLLAGALLEFPTVWILPLALAYAGIRGVAKVVGAGTMAQLVRLPFSPPRRIGLGLIPQGGISLAMAISVLLAYQDMVPGAGTRVETFFAVVVLGVVVSELVGPFFTTHVLRRAGEISPRVEEALEEGDAERAQEEAIRDMTSEAGSPDGSGE